MWAVGDDGRVQVLGIWLGGRTTADGHDYGRFGHGSGAHSPSLAVSWPSSLTGGAPSVSSRAAGTAVTYQKGADQRVCRVLSRAGASVT